MNINHKRAFIFFLEFSLISILCACGDNDIVKSGRPYGIRTTIEVSPAIINYCDTIEIKIHVINYSDENAIIDYWCFPFDYKIIDSKGDGVGGEIVPACSPPGPNSVFEQLVLQPYEDTVAVYKYSTRGKGTLWCLEECLCEGKYIVSGGLSYPSKDKYPWDRTIFEVINH